MLRDLENVEIEAGLLLIAHNIAKMSAKNLMGLLFLITSILWVFIKLENKVFTLILMTKQKLQ